MFQISRTTTTEESRHSSKCVRYTNIMLLSFMLIGSRDLFISYRLLARDNATL